MPKFSCLPDVSSFYIVHTDKILCQKLFFQHVSSGFLEIVGEIDVEYNETPIECNGILIEYNEIPIEPGFWELMEEQREMDKHIDEDS